MIYSFQSKTLIIDLKSAIISGIYFYVEVNATFIISGILVSMIRLLTAIIIERGSTHLELVDANTTITRKTNL